MYKGGGEGEISGMQRSILVTVKPFEILTSKFFVLLTVDLKKRDHFYVKQSNQKSCFGNFERNGHSMRSIRTRPTSKANQCQHINKIKAQVMLQKAKSIINLSGL